METTFDFRIKQQAYKTALDIYEELGAVLEEEVTRQTEAGQTIGSETTGETTLAFQKRIRDFHTNGIYGEACNKTKELYRIMKDALVEINALLARCEGFADQLKNNAYVEPVRPVAGDDRVWNGGILALDYDKITGIKNLCDDITDDNLHIKWQLESIIADYGHLVPEIKSYTSYVDSASGKLNRIQNFKDSFQEYESGIRALEYDLTIQLSSMTEPFGALNLIPENLKGNTIFEIEQLENIFNISYITGNEEWKEITEEYILRGDDAVIRMLAQQIFSRDDAEWTEGQIYYIAQTLDYAVQNDKTDLISMYVENLLEEKYVLVDVADAKPTTGTARYTHEYVVEGKREIVTAVIDNLDIKKQEETYYIIKRILQTSICAQICNIGVLEPKSIGGAYDVEAQLVNGEIELLISIGRGKKSGKIDVVNSLELKPSDIYKDYCVVEEYKKIYGFTEEEALLLYDAIEKLGESCDYERDSAAYINYVYGTLSTLCISYDATRWRLTASTPDLVEAKDRLYAAGFSSQRILDLQVLINLQHGDFSDETLEKEGIHIKKSAFCNETNATMMSRCIDTNNDFSHQTIQIAAFASEEMLLEEHYILPGTWAVGLFNSSDFQHSYTKYEISFKGDIDSGRYSKADFQSDVDAINIYERMRKNNESSLNNTWIEYYREVEIGDINRATEFFCNLGNGDEGIGIIGLSNILEKKTYGSEYIQKGNNMSEEKIDEYSSIFVKWIFSEYYGYEYEVPKPN